MKPQAPLIFTALEFEARALTGCGPVRAIGLRACRLPGNLRELNPSCIVMAGIAGALDPALAIGDVVVDDPGQLCPAEWRRGEIHTVATFVARPEAKASLFRSTRAAAVEMENAIVRRAAQEAGIPFVGIRAISDTAQQFIDPAVLPLADDAGRIRPLAVAALLIRRPWIVPHLRRVGADSKRALLSLATAVREIHGLLSSR